MLLFELHPHVVEDERVDVCLLFKDFGEGLAATMTCLGVNADKDGSGSGMALLQTCCEFERVCRHHTVVMIGSGHKRSGVRYAFLQVVKRRVAFQVLEHLAGILAGSIV